LHDGTNSSDVRSVEPENRSPRHAPTDRHTDEIVDKHYDKATKNEQMERREDCLMDV
jgi:hypothetical protein